MYLEHYGLLEHPFSIAPDPRYLYMSERHREALAHLLYGLNSDGAFILLSGDVGTGKTTVSRCLLEQVPDDTNLALVLNPKLNSMELLQVICDELGISYQASEMNAKTLVDHINRYLLESHAAGKKTVVLVEEAQNLDLDVLEQLRLLTNLETSERKLLQVILLGQPELLDILDRHELSQLAQRITARFHLSPLDQGEVAEYIGHRLAVAGCRRPVFASGVIRQIYKFSGGVPRLINVICDRALLGSFVQNRHQVDAKTLHKAAKEVLGENQAAARSSSKKPYLYALVAVFCALVAAGVYFSSWAGWQGVPALVPEVVSSESQENASESEESVASKEEFQIVENDTAPDSVMDEAGVNQVASDFIQWPGESQRLRSNFQAYRTLFGRWNVDYDLSRNGTPCFYAQTQGLSCLHEVSDIDSLLTLNRPAILKLYDDYNQSQYVTLLGIGEGGALIELGGRQQQVSLQHLLFYWKGEYSMLWKNSSGVAVLIRPGSEGESVVWLSEVMNRINNTPENATSSYYDTNLINRVKQFQLSRGIDDDGVVGVKTLIHINHAIGIKAPALEKTS